jgi:hypothetical protein
VNVQGGAAPAWLIVTVVPATVSVPVRGVVAVFGATVNASGPLPVPPAACTVIQLALLTAFQVHDGADAVTVTWLPPPSAGTATVVGATVNAQGGGVVAAACMTETVVPATVSVPDRAIVVVFGATT